MKDYHSLKSKKMENWQEIYDEIGFEEYILMLENSNNLLSDEDIKLIQISKLFHYGEVCTSIIN